MESLWREIQGRLGRFTAKREKKMRLKHLFLKKIPTDPWNRPEKVHQNTNMIKYDLGFPNHKQGVLEGGSVGVFLDLCEMVEASNSRHMLTGHPKAEEPTTYGGCLWKRCRHCTWFCGHSHYECRKTLHGVSWGGSLRKTRVL